MNELKQEDVMKALECCIKTQCENCCNLGSWHEQWNCMTDLMKKALALLREKDALLEQWDADFKTYEAMLNSKDAEIERLKAAAEEAVRSFTRLETLYNLKCKQLETTRTEAITEFAEKLKEAVKYIPWCDYQPVHNCIDQISEKMKGETDGESDL